MANDGGLELDATQRGFVEGQRVFDRYRLERILGRGGMGVVWLAFDEQLERRVALKFVPELVCLDKEAIADLKRETRRSLEITHPNIVRIYDFEQDATTAAISMEYVEGMTLSELKVRRRGCLGVGELRPMLRRLCEALDYAHLRARVVHRDLKPANLMVTEEGELKVTDFGISCSISDSVSRVSLARGTSGTVVFMSPQQALGERPTAADDIYALGATIYDLLTGKPPFYRGDILAQVRESAPVPMATRREELGFMGEPIPDAWEGVVRACLEKAAAARPPSAGEVFRRLDGGGAQLAAPAVDDQRSVAQEGGLVRPGRGWRWAIAVAGLALVAGGAWVVWCKRSVGPGGGEVVVAATTPVKPESPVAPGGSSSGAAVGEGAATQKPAAAPAGNAAAPSPPAAPPQAASVEERARGGDAAAQYEMGVACRGGVGRLKDLAKAVEWFGLAAAQGHAGAQNALGDAYRKGEGVGRNYEEALKWIRKAAEQGEPGGQANLGYLYSHGYAVRRDPVEAVKWYRMAAQQGDPDGLNRLGYSYSSGRGVPEDLGRAVELYGGAMAKGSLKAQVNLAMMYRDGRGVEKDVAKALELCRDAAEKGYEGAWNALGQAYEYGHGVGVDLAEAVSWYRKAAEAGDAGGQCNLGLQYERGKAVAQDFAVAMDWYRRAAEQDDPRGQSYLALMYDNRVGFGGDPAKAAELYRAAAEQGYPMAMNNLGVMYAKGRGVPKDEARAAALYAEAAELNHVTALRNLAALHEAGRGVPKDAEKAADLRRRADALGKEAPAGANAAPAAAAKAERIFGNGNLAAVGTGPTAPTVFQINKAFVITRIMTYHWNDGRGATPGTIALRAEDGRVHGPWQAAGSLGQGGIRNAVWEVAPNATLPPGIYRILDSDPRTWAQNAESRGRGIAEVDGVPAAQR